MQKSLDPQVMKQQKAACEDHMRREDPDLAAVVNIVIRGCRPRQPASRPAPASQPDPRPSVEQATDEEPAS